MHLVTADVLDEYGLPPDFSFIIADPENTRYVRDLAHFSYIKEGSETVGFMAFHEQESQMVIHYISLDGNVSLSSAEAFISDLSSGKEVYAVTYDCNRAETLFEAMGFYREAGLQYMEMETIPHFRSPYGLEFVSITTAKVPRKMSSLYNTCFSVSDGKRTLEEFVSDPLSTTGTDLILRREGRNIGFWVDVTYFGTVCFNCWIGIVPRHRRKGYATQLMEYALTAAAEKGCTRAGLLVNPRNDAAVKFYHQMGFTKQWGRLHFRSELD
ncbi:MAG: GNAT family N-acetyltransferase [Theionarchaea archaeon]|nr:GNAT family N-acetyltransferase [Theionarchaea archaeon]MBU7035967.1 GNAT family N-acetyltransferase [Theionarchaea archaeon]